MTGLLEQLADYGADHDEQQGRVDVADVIAAVGSHTAVEEPIQPLQIVTIDGADDPAVRHLRQPPWDDDAQSRRKGWSGVVLAVAATVLVVVGVVVVADGDRGEEELEPTSSSLTDPVAAPIDPALYRWSRVPHDQAAFDSARGQLMTSVTVGGPGLVAVGANDGSAAVWTSVDGTTWSRVPHHADFGGAVMTSVIAGGPGLVAVGYDGRLAAVWTSVDGNTWSRVPHQAVFALQAEQQMSSVTAGGPGLVAVGAGGEADSDDQGAAVWTSVDGITWSRVPHDDTIFGDGAAAMESVTAGGPGLVAVGAAEPAVDANGERCCQRAVVWTSVDGLSWSRVPEDEAVFDGRGGQAMNSVTVGGPGLVAVGYEMRGDDVPSGLGLDAAVWTSADGITWSRVPHERAVFGWTENQRMYGVAATGDGLVAVGADGGYPGTPAAAAVWTSADGITWSRMPHDDTIFGDAAMSDVVAIDNGVVAIGDDVREGHEPESTLVWIAGP
jgi:hypothetical protein